MRLTGAYWKFQTNMLVVTKCDCKNSFLLSQESGDRDQESVKTKTYGADLFLNYSFPDFLQVHLTRIIFAVSDLGTGTPALIFSDVKKTN